MMSMADPALDEGTCSCVLDSSNFAAAVGPSGGILEFTEAASGKVGGGRKIALMFWEFYLFKFWAFLGLLTFK